MEVSTLIQAYKCYGMGYREIFRRIPQSFVGGWVECEFEYVIND